MDWINPDSGFTNHDFTVFSYPYVHVPARDHHTKEAGLDSNSDLFSLGPEPEQRQRAVAIWKSDADEVCLCDAPITTSTTDHTDYLLISGLIARSSHQGRGSRTSPQKQLRMTPHYSHHFKTLRCFHTYDHVQELWTLIEQKVPGTYTLICPRAPEVFPGQPSLITDLPFSEDIWKYVTDKFHVHRNITRTILRNVAYFSAIRHRPEDSGQFEICQCCFCPAT